MKRVCLLITILLIASPLFCAEQDKTKACVDKKGAIHIQLRDLDDCDFGAICVLANCMHDNLGEPVALSGYKKGLLRVDTIFQSMYCLMLSSAHTNPRCVEYMLREYISLREQSALYAFFENEIGEGYRFKGRHRDAIRMYTNALQIVPNAPAIFHLASMHNEQNNFQAAAYWADQYKQRNFKKGIFQSNILELYRKASNEESGQERNPKEFLKFIRSYQPEDPNERVLVEKYNSIFKKDQA